MTRPDLRSAAEHRSQDSNSEHCQDDLRDDLDKAFQEQSQPHLAHVLNLC